MRMSRASDSVSARLGQLAEDASARSKKSTASRFADRAAALAPAWRRYARPFGDPRPRRVVREHLDVLAEPIRVQALDRIDDRRVERAPPLVEHRPYATSCVSACLKVYSRSGNSRAS